MIEVKAASHKDVEDIVEVGEKFWGEHYYSHYGDFDPASTRNALHNIIDGESSVVIVAKDGEQIVGYIAFIIAFVLWGDVKSAAEVLWWVEKDRRKEGVGKDLLGAGLEWAEIMGCDVLEAHDGSGKRIDLCVTQSPVPRSSVAQAVS